MAKELGFKLITSETLDGGQKVSYEKIGNGKEAGDGGSAVVENTSEAQQGLAVTENCGVVVSANVSTEENSDNTGSEAEVKIANVVSEVSAANGTADDSKVQSDGVNGQINGAVDIPASPSFHKNKGTWADVVSNSTVANKKGDKLMSVNRAANNIAADGAAED